MTAIAMKIMLMVMLTTTTILNNNVAMAIRTMETMLNKNDGDENDTIVTNTISGNNEDDSDND